MKGEQIEYLNKIRAMAEELTQFQINYGEFPLFPYV
jgi:hypothetical protein